MSLKTTRRTVIVNFLWNFIERCGGQVVSLVVSIVLARILMPEAYGTIALITVFTNVFSVFIDSGLGSALIQKKNATELDFSTVFWFNIFMCVVLYVLLFAASPAIADFYNDESLVFLIRIIGIVFIVSGLRGIQNCYISRNMMFKKSFFATLGASVFSGVIGISMAYAGCGVWALAAQIVSSEAIGTIVLWFLVGWRPSLCFSFESLRNLFGYGWKILLSQLLDTGFLNFRQLIIGKMYCKEDLAFYNKGSSWPNLLVNNIDRALNSILFPVMSREQDSAEKVKKIMRRTMKTSIFLLAPILMWLCFASEPLIDLVLTEKWLPAVPFMRIFCITFMFFPLHTANLSAIKAMGRSDYFLVLEILKKLFDLIVLLCTMWFGVMAIAYGLLLNSVISQIINSWPNKRLINYAYSEQLKDILPSIVLAVVMGICIFPVQHLPVHTIVILLIQAVLGAVVYLIGSKLAKLEAFDYLWGIVKNSYIKKMGKR